MEEPIGQIFFFFTADNKTMAKMKLTARRREYSFETPGGYRTFYFYRILVIQVQALGVAEFLDFVHHRPVF
jgi:hypothetical protein